MRRFILRCFLSLVFAFGLPDLAAQPRILGVANSATYFPGLPGEGSLATVFCTGLTGLGGVVQAGGFPLPTLLEGVSVTLRGVPAPILAVADLGTYQQVNLQVPWTLPRDAPSRLVLSQHGQSATLEPVPAGGWSVFFRDGRGYAVAQRVSDYSPITPERPARPGELVVVYGTHFGPVYNTPPTGVPAGNHAFATMDEIGPYRNYSALVNNQVAISPPGAFYLGLAPGLVGVYQANFRVPEDATGDVELSLGRTICGGLFGGCTPTTGGRREQTVANVLLPVRRP